MPSNSKILIRNFTFKQAFKAWLSNSQEQEIKVLRKEYEDYLIEEGSETVLAEKNQEQEGIIWRNLEGLNVTHLLDYLRSQIIGMGYYNYLSDVRTEYFDGGVKLEYERYVLKPYLKVIKNESLNFGTIHLENCKQPTPGLGMLKVMVTSEHNNLPFHQLMQELLRSNKE